MNLIRAYIPRFGRRTDVRRGSFKLVNFEGPAETPNENSESLFVFNKNVDGSSTRVLMGFCYMVRTQNIRKHVG